MNTQKYAISEYHDTKEVYARLDRLISEPMRPVKREKMEEFLHYFEEYCKRSKALTDEARKLIPGGVQHNLAFNYPFPVAIEKAEGAYLWDADGNQYIEGVIAKPACPGIRSDRFPPVAIKYPFRTSSCAVSTICFFKESNVPTGTSASNLDSVKILEHNLDTVKIRA